MTPTPKPRTVDQLMAAFTEELERNPAKLHELVRKYITTARTEITLEMVERKAAAYQGCDGHPYAEEYG